MQIEACLLAIALAAACANVSDAGHGDEALVAPDSATADTVGPGQFTSLTATEHLTGSATQSNVTVNMTAVGAGVNGPENAQLGLAVNATKDNWFRGPAKSGEIDGVGVMLRQGGTESDASGILVNVQNTGLSFLAMDEMVSSIVDPVTNVITHEIDVQDGVLNKRTGDFIGRVFNADTGSLYTAMLIQNSGVHASWGNIVVNIKNGVQNFTIDDNGNVDAASVSVTGAMQLGTSPYASLPVPGVAGRMLLCTDCRKPGEMAGAGTGMTVFDDGRRWTTTAGTAVAR